MPIRKKRSIFKNFATSKNLFFQSTTFYSHQVSYIEGPYTVLYNKLIYQSTTFYSHQVSYIEGPYTVLYNDE